MIPRYNKIHNKFKLNGYHYNFNDLMDVAYSYVKEGEPYEQAIGEFLLDWLDDSEFVISNTSGTTGLPKTIKLKKQHMVNSAIATGNFFDLKPGDTALHCLPADYIAGKMMLVRAMVLGLDMDLTEPSSIPIFDYEKPYELSAMVPLQLKHMKGYIQNINKILVGGAAISNVLKQIFKDCPTNLFETYGMTETVSHIAARRLNNFQNSKDDEPERMFFTVLPNVAIRQDLRGCLTVDAPFVSDGEIITNDLVKMHSDTTFEWLGRIDNIINSGGIKISPELVENKLSNVVENRFFIASEPDEDLGEKVIMLVEGTDDKIDGTVFENLDKYEIPKEIYYLDAFETTYSGKIKRKETLKLVQA
jgi:o-succinylbenzoate---CoA ligase